MIFFVLVKNKVKYKMLTFNYKRWNNLLGWFSFSVALIVYSLTVEPTLSFWDCGEYISTAAKLEVGHPPGAPLYQMLGAFFAMFAFSADKVALMVNMMSVFSSAFTILFMYWSLTIILKKIIFAIKKEWTNENAIMVLGSALLGSLVFTFSDSFWYNAVEAEVYAMASLFIALLFWLGLRWEQEMNEPRGNRWLLLISLMVGLSFGVHFMALLVIPSLGFLYYFKHYKEFTIKGFVIANIIVVSVLLFIFKMLLPLSMALFAKAEVFFVNSIGLPFNSGTIIVTLGIILAFYFGLEYTKKHGHILYNTLVLCVLFVFIGFSSWLMLPIRSNANVVINENKPSDAREVLAYYNREQYGETKLFYGPQFSDSYAGLDKDNPYKDDQPNYERDYKTGKYVIVNNYKNATQNFDDAHKTILPRLWSPDHAENYMIFTDVLEFKIKPEYLEEKELVDIVNQFKTSYYSGQIEAEGYHKFLKNYGDYLIVEKPTFWNNISFMVEYQFGYMYWRYLMWNFSGRQNDIQGKYNSLYGNWISGINFLDEIRLGSQDLLPSDLADNKGRNAYYLIPFLLGMIGLFYHAKSDLKSFYVLLVLFVFTGLALKIYLNERPFEPRERDYALVGSFYVFAIWIGIGVFAIYDKIRSFLQPKIAIPAVLATVFLAAPVVMASENWDDHDRSDKYTALANAKAYLDSCDKNAILFTIGDNDTFPLWYLQEIEKYRTDIRVVNTSLFMTDWYVDQMKLQSYESKPLPISFEHHQYVQGTRDAVLFDKKTDKRWDINDFIRFIASDNPQTIVELQNGQKIHFYPTNKIRIPVDKNRVITNQKLAVHQHDSIVPYIDVDITAGALYKNRLMMLDVVANNNWERPIYFTGGAFADEDYIWMKEYLQLEGLTYKLVPIKSTMKDKDNPMEMGGIDSEKMYTTVMKWDWGNSNSPNIYHDPETRKNSITFRTNLCRLMNQLILEGKKEKATKIADLAMDKFPIKYYEYYTLVEPFAEGYYDLGQKEKAREVLNDLKQKYQESLTYFNTMSASKQENYYVEIVTDIERYRNLLFTARKKEDMEYYNQNKSAFNNYNKMFSRFGRDNEK